MKKITGGFVKIYNAVLPVFPFLTSVILAIICLFDGWSVLIGGFNNAHFRIKEFDNIAFAILFVIGLLAVIVSLASCARLISRFFSDDGKQHSINMLLIFLCCFSVRFVLIALFSEDWQPFSDFQEVWDLESMDRGGDRFIYWTAFPSYMNYSVFEHVVRILFGDSYTNLLYLNCLFSAFTAVILYLITYVVTERKRIAIYAGLLYAMLFQNIFYCTWGTPEFLTVCLNSLGILLLLVYKKMDNAWKYAILAVAGISLGISASYKAFAIIIIIAFVMELILSDIMENQGTMLKRAALILLSVLVMFTSYRFTKKLILDKTCDYYGMHFTEATATAHFLMIGLNTQNEGQIEGIGIDFITTYMSTKGDGARSRDEAMNTLKQDWRENYGDFPKLLAMKIIWVWQSETDLLGDRDRSGPSAENINSPLEKVIYDFWRNDLNSVIHISYLGIMAFAFIGIVLLNKEERSDEFGFMMISLIIFGFACLMLLSEAQARYKCLVMPYICIFSSIGLLKGQSMLKRGILRIKKQVK